MTDTEKQVQSLESRVNRIYELVGTDISRIDRNIEGHRRRFQRITDARIGRIDARTISALQKAYTKTSYDIVKIYFPGSPSIIGIITTVISVFTKIYDVVKTVMTVCHIATVIKIIQIVSKVSPKVRSFIDNILGDLPELAKAIGQGATMFHNVMHAMQGTVSATAGMLGKDWKWVEGKFMEKTLSISQDIQLWSEQIQKDPASFIDQVFVDQKMLETREQSEAWGTVWDGIEKGLSWGEEALANTQDLFNELEDLRDAMPDYVKKNIPDSISTDFTDIHKYLDNTVAPTFHEISKTISQINKAATADRKDIDDLTDRLSRAGNYVYEIEGYDEEKRQLQEGKVDSVSAAQFNREATAENEETQAVFKEMQRVAAAGISPGTTPDFMGLEPSYTPRPPGAEAKGENTWFVGDY